jgi:hypothetical protein
LAAQETEKRTLMEMEKERRNALLTDFVAMRYDLKAGKPEDAMARVQNRLNDLRGLGASDVSHTAHIGRLLSQKNYEQAEEELDRFVQTAQDTGMITAPESNLTVGAGMLVKDDNGNIFYTIPVTNRRTGATEVNISPVIPGQVFKGPIKGIVQRGSGQTASEAVDTAGQKAANVAENTLTVEGKLKPGVEGAVAEETARRSVVGTARGEAQVNLQQAEENANYMISVLRKAIDHPGRVAATGASSILDPRNFYPGSDAYDFNVLRDQIQGRTFLQAYQMLKGGGQITEIEGQKAEAAMARMNTAQSEEAWLEGANEFIQVIERGLERDQAAAGQKQRTQQRNMLDLEADPGLLEYMTPDERALFDDLE